MDFIFVYYISICMKVGACGLTIYLVNIFSNCLNCVEIFLKQRASVSVFSTPLEKKNKVVFRNMQI